LRRQLFQYHPDFGYNFVPGLQTRVDHEGGGYLVSVNQAGFRCRHEFVKTKTEGKFRVLLFGDSNTAGDGVSNKDRYGDVLESLLPNLEVFNFGLPGSGTDQQYIIYRELASEIECDLIVIGVLVENIRRVVARYRVYFSQDGESIIMAKPYFLMDRNGNLTLHHVPVPKGPILANTLSLEDRAHIDQGGDHAWIRKQIGKLGSGFKDLAQTITQHQPLPEYEQADNPAWLLLKATIAKWMAETRVPVIIAPLPLYQYIEDMASPQNYQKRFRELEQMTNVMVHDPLPDFQRVPRSERRSFRFARDPHYTRAAHRVLAESLAPVIEPLMKKERP